MKQKKSKNLSRARVITITCAHVVVVTCALTSHEHMIVITFRVIVIKFSKEVFIMSP